MRLAIRRRITINVGMMMKTIDTATTEIWPGSSSGNITTLPPIVGVFGADAAILSSREVAMGRRP